MSVCEPSCASPAGGARENQTGPENQPGLGQKVPGHSQEEFQRIFGFSKNRTTTLKRLVCALEALYQAQN